MARTQKCNKCGEKLLLTEVTTNTNKKIWVYMCGCDELVRGCKEKEAKQEASINASV